jgi:hypothetical protein
MTTCVYCRTQSEIEFPKEHVIPEAFGRFYNNLTLSCVCAACNSLFNRNLEVFLARDSVEAFLRVRYGLKAKSGRRVLGRTRLTIRVISPGDWCGSRMIAERNERGDEVKVWPLPQVGFKKFGESEREWLLESELDQTQRWERYRVDAEAHIVGRPQAAVRRLADKLQALGVVFKCQGEMENHRNFVQIFADSILDETIFRCAAKIAFNFLAYCRGNDFALRSDFDPIRHYIRNGVTTTQPFVLVTNNPILVGDCSQYRQTDGHLIIVDWNSTHEGIVCSLSLFNHLTYHVNLCSNFSGLWYPLSDGRHFDLRTLTISEVRVINKSLLI